MYKVLFLLLFCISCKESKPPIKLPLADFKVTTLTVDGKVIREQVVKLPIDAKVYNRIDWKSFGESKQVESYIYSPSDSSGGISHREIIQVGEGWRLILERVK